LGKPVWRIVAEMSPEEFVSCIDFRYITDAITPEEAVKMLKEQEAGKADRMKDADESRAVPAYTTSAGWLGYGEEKVKELLKEMLAEGYKHFKMKVGGSVEADRKRLAIAREMIGYDKGNILMVDANQVWNNCLPGDKLHILTFDNRSGPYQRQSNTCTSSRNSNRGSSRSPPPQMTF
jgi:L-galactonate dehydratase